MLTLTYAPEITWEPEQIGGLVRCVRAYLARRGVPFRFVWVMELTKAGRPHYHMIIWLPRGLTLPKPDKQGWWPYGSTRIEWARSPVGYITKYASKGHRDDDAGPDDPDGTGGFPRGARIHGNGGLSASGRMVKVWRLCPAWVRELFTVEDRPQRAPGGGWLSWLTGWFEPAR